MTSDRQQAANRQNSANSTGPRSATGKARSSQNARSHGLSISSLFHTGWTEQAEALANLLAGEDVSDLIQLETARIAAGAHFDAIRARQARADLIEEFLAAPDIDEDPMPVMSCGGIAGLDATLGFNLTSLFPKFPVGMSPAKNAQLLARLDRQANKILERPRPKPTPPDAYLARAQKLTRYIRRASSRRKVAVRALRPSRVSGGRA